LHTCRVSRSLTKAEIQRFQVPTPLKFDFAKRQCPPALGEHSAEMLSALQRGGPAAS